MDSRADVVKQLLMDYASEPASTTVVAFAPANIALCKYWGKRNTALNLPTTTSLSISLGHLGATTTLRLNHRSTDCIKLNGEVLDPNISFSKRLRNFLDLFRFENNFYFDVETHSNIPVAAGLASSACGFAAVVLALDQLFQWQLPKKTLSILARLGSGSASRSLWQGFVEWRMGIQDNGSDSMGIPLDIEWPELRVGLVVLDPSAKTLSSREAMQSTVLTSPFYEAWTNSQKGDCANLKQALYAHDFERMALIAEANALRLHALMLSASPPILYSNPETIHTIHHIWDCRKKGLPVFFTQDAGPNLKLLFLEKDIDSIQKTFPAVQIVNPFEPNWAAKIPSGGHPA